MEIEGMIIRIFDPVGGTSQRTGNTWKKREYVLETPGQYPRKIKFDVWGDKSDSMLFELGKSYAVSVDIESREFNDRWYTDVKAFAMRPIENGQTQAPGPVSNMGGAPQNPYSQPQFGQPAPAPQNPFGSNPAPDFAAGNSDEDLPF